MLQMKTRNIYFRLKQEINVTNENNYFKFKINVANKNKK